VLDARAAIHAFVVAADETFPTSATASTASLVRVLGLAVRGLIGITLGFGVGAVLVGVGICVPIDAGIAVFAIVVAARREQEGANEKNQERP